MIVIVDPFLAVPIFLSLTSAISTVIIQMDRTPASYHAPLVIACLLAVTIVLWGVPGGGAHRTAADPTGITVVNRLFGLVLASLAVEIMANGLKQLFPSLAAG